MALRTFCGHLFTIALTWSNDLLIQIQNNRHINNSSTFMWVASLVCVEPVKQVKLYPCRWGGACAAEDVVDLRHQGTLTIRKWNTQRYLMITLLWCLHCQTWNEIHFLIALEATYNCWCWCFLMYFICIAHLVWKNTHFAVLYILTEHIEAINLKMCCQNK